MLALFVLQSRKGLTKSLLVNSPEVSPTPLADLQKKSVHVEFYSTMLQAIPGS
jgi:hypothetical protein